MKSFSVVIAFVLIGTIFLVGGVSATVNRAMTTATCEACGMEIEKSDISSSLVISADQTEHWACCPICADVIALHYQDAEVQGKCYACGKEVIVHVEDSQLSFIEYSGNKEFIKIMLGGLCMKNKLVCSGVCAQSVHQSYEWAADVPEKTLQEALTVANNKLQTMTVGYKPVSFPAMNYVLIASSAVLLAAAPIAWKFLNKRSKTVIPTNSTE